MNRTKKLNDKNSECSLCAVEILLSILQRESMAVDCKLVQNQIITVVLFFRMDDTHKCAQGSEIKIKSKIIVN